MLQAGSNINFLLRYSIRAAPAGFTYLYVLIVIAALTISINTAHVAYSYHTRKDLENELIFSGLAYKNAIKGYYDANGVLPRKLEDLLVDNKQGYQRHIRKLYKDPIGKKEWRLVMGEDGGIAGVASSSQRVPLKKHNFPKDLEHFSDSKSYAEWTFEYKPKAENGQLLPEQQPFFPGSQK